MSSTRRGLLTGAARAFARSGLRRSTMQSVADAAGVAKATLYNHFRTKDEFARALLALELQRLVATAAALPTAEALALLSDELGGHPVLSRLAETEPEILLAWLGSGAWEQLTGSLAATPRCRRRRRRAGGALAAPRGAPARPVHDPAPARRAAGRRPGRRLTPRVVEAPAHWSS